MMSGLRTALAMGAAEAVLISDPELAGLRMRLSHCEGSRRCAIPPHLADLRNACCLQPNLPMATPELFPVQVR